MLKTYQFTTQCKGDSQAKFSIQVGWDELFQPT